MSLLNFWTAWLDRLPRLCGGPPPNHLDPALLDQLHVFMSQSPTGQPGSWTYRLDVSNFLRNLGDLVVPLNSYEVVELAWTGADPLTPAERRRYETDVMDLLWWVIFVDPVMHHLTSLIRAGQPTPGPRFSGVLTKPLYHQRQIDMRRLALLVEIARRFGESWPTQIFCLFRSEWLLRFLFCNLPRHLRQQRFTLDAIRLVAMTLADPALPYRHQLDDAAHQLNHLDPADDDFVSRHSCIPMSWPSLLDASMSPLRRARLGLVESHPSSSSSVPSTPSSPANASIAPLVTAMETIVLAGHWSVHHPGHESSPDAAIRRYVEAYLLPSVSPLIRDKFQPYRADGPSFARARPIFTPVPTQGLEQGRLWLTRYCAARSFAWGKPEILEHVARCSSDAAFFEIARMDAFKHGFWANLVYGEHRWNAIEHAKVEEAWPALIDALQNLLHLGGPPPSSGPVPFARVLQSFGQGSRGSRTVARVVRLQPSGLIPWLIVCDLAWYWPDHVAPPTVDDLASKIHSAGGTKSGGGGPWSAFQHIDPRWAGGRQNLPTLAVIRAHLETIRNALTDRLPPQALQSFSSGHLSWEDVEHILCKVTRSHCLDADATASA